MIDYGDRIFENYSFFIKEHKDDLGTPSGAIEMLSSDGAFRAYIDALTEGMDASTKRSIFAIAQREREMVLEESINVGPSASVVGYAVSYFPILADIYSDPVLSQIATTYPVNKSIMTIPKVKIESSVKNSNGTVSRFTLPTTTQLVRAAPETINLLPAINNSLFNMSTGGLITSDSAFINKRYFIINNIKVVDATNATIDISTMCRPDARGQINDTVEFDSGTGDRYSITIIGNINWDTGSVQFNSTFANLTTPAVNPTAKLTSITANVLFSPRTGDIGRVKVGIKTSGWDINIDVNDDFEILLDQEVIQDYTDIYNIDMIRTLSLAIKNQMLLNKDRDLAYFLSNNESIFAANGSAQIFDLSKFETAANNFTPANITDIFKGVVPYITTVNRNIRRIFRADPQFLVAGLKTSSLLESLQGFMVGFSNYNSGEAGFSSQNAAIDFRKQKIIACDAIPDNKIYAVYKAPNDDLTRTAIVDLIYKPLYVIEEIDNSRRRTFVKSRTTIELTAPEAIGVITMVNYDKYL